MEGKSNVTGLSENASPLKRKAEDSNNIHANADSAKKLKYDDDDKRRRKGSPEHRDRKKEKKAKRSKEEKQKHKKALKKEEIDDSFYEDDFSKTTFKYAGPLTELQMSVTGFRDHTTKF